MNIEQEVVSFLIYQDFNTLKRVYPDLKEAIWLDAHKPFYQLLTEYLVEGKDYKFSDLLISEYPDKFYLNKLLQGFVPEPVGKRAISRFLKEQAKLRLRKQLSALGGQDPDEALKALKALKSSKSRKPSNLGNIREARIDERELEKVAPSTGYEELDNIIKGFVPGRLYTMTGQTNIGKTQIACNFAYEVAKQGKRVLYFALEPGNNLIEYLASIWANKEFNLLTPENLKAPKGIKIDVFTKDQVDTLDDLVETIDSLERYDLIIIDHFGYFTTNEKVNKTVQESNAIKRVVQMAKQKRTAVLSIVHLRKPQHKSRKTKQIVNMDDISGSAAFKQDSTDVLLLMRDQPEEDEFGILYDDTGYILVAKTKSGKNGVVKIKFLQGTGKIIQDSDGGGLF